jgi:Tfp pilus assembly protein PilX
MENRIKKVNHRPWNMEQKSCKTFLKSSIFYGLGSKKEGFSMLFAVLASSLVLSIGLSIFNLTLKEIALSSSGRESQFSFYAADSGSECALYWDVKDTNTNIFATSSAYASRNPSNPAPECGSDNQAINVSPVTTVYSPAPPAPTPTSATTQFQFDVYKPGDVTASKYCARVKVIKTDVGGLTETVIESRGYNNSCGSMSVSDPNRVERALRIKY